MSYVLRKAKTESITLTMKGGVKHTFKIPIKPALVVSVCAACGKKFQMRGKTDAGRWEARMDGCPGQLGNMHHLDCCSYSCAGDLSAGKWKKPTGDKLSAGEAKQYDRAKCDVEFSEFTMGQAVYEEELLEEWEAVSRVDIQINVLQKFSNGTTEQIGKSIVLE